MNCKNCGHPIMFFLFDRWMHQAKEGNFDMAAHICWCGCENARAKKEAKKE